MNDGNAMNGTTAGVDSRTCIAGGGGTAERGGGLRAAGAGGLLIPIAGSIRGTAGSGGRATIS